MFTVVLSDVIEDRKVGNKRLIYFYLLSENPLYLQELFLGYIFQLMTSKTSERTMVNKRQSHESNPLKYRKNENTPLWCYFVIDIEKDNIMVTIYCSTIRYILNNLNFTVNHQVNNLIHHFIFDCIIPSI